MMDTVDILCKNIKVTEPPYLLTLGYLSDIEDTNHGMLTSGDDLSSPWWSSTLNWHVVLAYQASLHQ